MADAGEPAAAGPPPRRPLHEAAWPDMFESLQLAYSELTQAKRESEERAAEVDDARELFEQVVDSMSDLLLVADESGKVVRANRVARALLGDRELAGVPLAGLLPPEVPATPWELFERDPSGLVANVDVELRAGAARRQLSVSSGLVRGKDGRITGLVVAGRDITERRRAEDAIALLADAGRALAESLDYEETVRRVAGLAVPALADCCAVYLHGSRGRLRRVGTAAPDARLAEPLDDVAPSEIAAAGEPDIVRAVRAAVRPRAPIADWRCVPMSVGGEVLGAICLFSTDAGREYRPTDLRLAEELASRAALAIQNARAYRHERGTAETLQRSLLPERLPDVPGVELAARYLPAAPAVGGDWYDAIPLPGGLVGVAMGDVAGHGTRAAAAMGQLRNALRAYAVEGHPPGEAVARLRALLPVDEMATLVYLVLDPRSGRLRYANAGHVPPIVVAPNGSARLLGGGGPPLYATLAGPLEEQTATLPTGGLMLLYTDGLVEVRGERLDHGLERLRRAARRAAARADLEAVIDEVLADVPETSEDDVAVLAVRAPGIDPGRLELVLPADPDALAQVRRALERWLAANGVPADDAFAVQVACGEACANAIEHSYGAAGGEFAVLAERHGERATFTVRDFGRWREPRGTNRGRGTPIMRAMMDEVEIVRERGGTTIRLHRSIGSPPERR